MDEDCAMGNAFLKKEKEEWKIIEYNCLGLGEKKPMTCFFFFGGLKFWIKSQNSDSRTDDKNNYLYNVCSIVWLFLGISQYIILKMPVGREFFSLPNKTLQTTLIIPGSGTFALPFSSLSLNSACLMRLSGKEQDVSSSFFFSNKVCHLPKTKMLAPSLH